MALAKSRLSWIDDDDDGQLGGGQFGDEELFESSGGLDHDEQWHALLELFAESFDPGGGVLESRGVPGGELVEIEVLLRDINADGKALAVHGCRNRVGNGRWRTGGILNGIRHETTLPGASIEQTYHTGGGFRILVMVVVILFTYRASNE